MGEAVHYRWERTKVDEENVRRLADAGHSPIIARVLAARGVDDPESAATYLHPLLAHLTPPDGFADLDTAVDRAIRAVRTGETIYIYGDYDVDGVTSTAVLLTFFSQLGANVRYYIPDRLNEGYGMNPAAVDTLHADGCRLIITVDCGISAHESIDHAATLGVDVIVTDHHQAGGTLPNACAVVNPNRPDCRFPSKDLAGVGIAFYLAAAIRSRLADEGREGLPDLRNLLDLVALGTVADVAPLVGENRIFARHGLRLLSEESRLGIKALKEAARIGKKPVNAGTVAFQLAPRINAVGRLSSSALAVKLLTTGKLTEALRLAHTLEEANRERRAIEKAIVDEARAMVVHDRSGAERNAIVLASERWHPGVVGIVASKLLDEFRKPTVLIAMKQGKGRGSARSVPAFDLHAGLTECAHTLLGYGGHPLAAGLQISADRLDEFRDLFDSVAGKATADADARPVLRVDDEIGLDEADADLIESFRDLEPFGVGNPEPVFVSRKVTAGGVRPVGRDHLKFEVADGEHRTEAIWFGSASRRDEVAGEIDVAYQARIDTYRGHSRPVLHVKDVRPAE